MKFSHFSQREEIETARAKVKEQTMAEVHSEMNRDRELAIQAIENQYRREIEECNVQLKVGALLFKI